MNTIVPGQKEKSRNTTKGKTKIKSTTTSMVRIFDRNRRNDDFLDPKGPNTRRRRFFAWTKILFSHLRCQSSGLGRKPSTLSLAMAKKESLDVSSVESRPLRSGEKVRPVQKLSTTAAASNIASDPPSLSNSSSSSRKVNIFRRKSFYTYQQNHPSTH